MRNTSEATNVVACTLDGERWAMQGLEEGIEVSFVRTILIGVAP
jgi:hypothetical protein